ncbi:MAG: hypothetical protein HY397_00540 [Candidatus Doudnabacteria bacterium]|nr:hypothetical protein [Candidatus Doudnabacteria bacterium]
MLASLRPILRKFPDAKRLHWYRYGDWESPVLRKELYFQGNIRVQFKAYTGLDCGLEYEVHNEPTVYAVREDHEKFLSLFFKNLARNPKYFAELTAKTERICATVERFILRLHKVKHWESFNRSGLDFWYSSFKRHYLSLFPYSFLWYQQEKFSKQLVAYALKLSNVKPDKTQIVIAKMMAAPLGRKPYSALAAADFLKMVLAVKKNPKLFRLFKTSSFGKTQGVLGNNDVKFSLDRHIRKYGWLSTRHWLGNPMSADEAFKQVKSLLKLNIDKVQLDRQAAARKAKLALGRLFEELHLSGPSKALINILRRHVFLKTYRKELLSKADFSARPLFTQIARRMHLDYRQLIYLRVSELENYLRQGKLPEISKLALRQKGYALLLYKSKVYLFENQFSKHAPWKGRRRITLTGTVAHGGLAEGFVRVVRRNRDIKRVRAGEILVCDMTNPNYLPALHKAAAFVTNRGGSLSHAVVLSRELDKPCLVNTRIATEVLKDGMRVVVDANRGYLKVLN